MTDIRIEVEGFDRIIFNKRELKKAIRQGGAVVRAEARRLVSKRAISAPGEFPGLQSGALKRSIKLKVGSGGGYAKVMPYKMPEMNHFYAAYLINGTSRGLRPRKDIMTSALDNKQEQIRARIRQALNNALQAV